MATRIGGSAILKVIHVGLWLGNRFLDVENPGHSSTRGYSSERRSYGSCHSLSGPSREWPYA